MNPRVLSHLFRTALLAGVFFAAFVLPSCYILTPPEERVAMNRDVIESEFHSEINRQGDNGSGGELKLSWGQALEKMYMHNPKLLEADFKVEDAVNQQKRVFTNLIPLISVGVSDSFEIGNIEDAFKDVNLRVYSYLPLGEIINMPKQIYTKKLLYMASQLNAEQTMRQEVIALYRLFQRQYLLDLEKKSIALEGAITKGLTGLDDVDAIKMREDYVKVQEEWVESYEEWRVEVGDFYMNDYTKIDLALSSLPKITYRPADLDFTDSGRWGMLQLNLLGMEKISKDAQILDTYLRYFPRPNFNVSAPPLYSETGGSSFDATDVRLGPSLNWSLDTRGVIGEQLNRIKREKPLEDWREDKRTREEVKKVLEGRDALGVIQEELKKTRQLIKGYRKVVKSGLVDDPRVAVRTMRRLRTKEVHLAAKEIEICTSFWLIDEERWTKVTKRWQETRKLRSEQRDVARKQQKKMAKDLERRGKR